MIKKIFRENIQNLSFPLTGCPAILSIDGGRRDKCMFFLRALAQSEMQRVSSRIWTQVTKFISYDDNCCAIISTSVVTHDLQWSSQLFRLFSVLTDLRVVLLSEQSQSFLGSPVFPSLFSKFFVIVSIIWYQLFLSNTNNLYIIIWFWFGLILWLINHYRSLMPNLFLYI